MHEELDQPYGQPPLREAVIGTIMITTNLFMAKFTLRHHSTYTQDITVVFWWVKGISLMINMFTEIQDNALLV